MNKIITKILTKENWEQYRFLRLSALRESPEAFSSKYQTELEYCESKWKARLNPTSKIATILPLAAFIDGIPLGLVYGVLRREESREIGIYQMWVAREAQRQGVGRVLLDHIVSWAKLLRRGTILLDVNEKNTNAISFYQSYGFTYKLEPSISDDSLPKERKMFLRFSVDD